MSDTSRVQLAYIKESSFNTKKTGSNLQIIRKVSEDLALQAQTHVSGEMNSDRQTSGIRRVQFSTAGPVNHELSYGTYDDWLASALQSAWQSPVTNGPKTTI
ncbi:MAG TPA: phage tail tube protein, partial [Phycisphaerae bacterium]|nr:phage tail tube protein [Phycisphaerae bacterium]